MMPVALVRRTGLLVAGVLAVLLLAGTLAYRYAYGSWWQAPQRIGYCGRTYAVGSSGLTLADVRARERETALPGDHPYPLVSIGRVPPVVGGQLLAALAPVTQRGRFGVPCTMVLYLRTGDDRYTAYAIVGGP